MSSVVPLNWLALNRATLYGEDEGVYAVNHNVHHDPLSIGVAVLVQTGFAGTISAGLATLIGVGVIGAAALGVGLLASKVFGGESNAEDRQQVLRQPFGPRIRSYGRVKVGGLVAFFESKAGVLFVQQTINQGEISAIEEIWFNDALVTLDGSGFVNEEPWNRGGGDMVAKVQFKMGTDAQTVHADLDSAFPQITSAHRLRGTANLLAQYEEVPAEDISEVYGSGNPSVRVVVDASLVEDVRTETVAWSDNPANAIYDYLVGVDGADFPYGAGFTEDDINRDSFEAFADLCDELQDLAGGGTIKQYRCWGTYALNEDMAAVLRRMLKTCDGDLYIDTDGKIAIRGGQFVTPALTLNASLGHIIAAEFRQGRDDLASFNELTISYVEPTLDYSTTETEVWVDTDNVALRGQVLPDAVQFEMVPHHAQARRLGKIHTKKSNPLWVGQVVTNFYGFNAIGEDTVHIVFAPLGIDHDFQIDRIEFLDDLTGCRISVSSLSADAYAWDADTEQGADPPEPPDTTDAVAPGIATGVSGTGGAGTIQFDWTSPNSANYAGARLYWNTTNSFADSALVATEYGPPNTADTRTVSGISAGTRYGWVVAINGSGVPAAEVATGSITVT